MELFSLFTSLPWRLQFEAFSLLLATHPQPNARITEARHQRSPFPLGLKATLGYLVNAVPALTLFCHPSHRLFLGFFLQVCLTPLESL